MSIALSLERLSQLKFQQMKFNLKFNRQPNVVTKASFECPSRDILKVPTKGRPLYRLQYSQIRSSLSHQIETSPGRQMETSLELNFT